jgi:hypothetical protein
MDSEDLVHGRFPKSSGWPSCSVSSPRSATNYVPVDLDYRGAGVDRSAPVLLGSLPVKARDILNITQQGNQQLASWYDLLDMEAAGGKNGVQSAAQSASTSLSWPYTQ